MQWRESVFDGESIERVGGEFSGVEGVPGFE